MVRIPIRTQGFKRGHQVMRHISIERVVKAKHSDVVFSQNALTLKYGTPILKSSSFASADRATTQPSLLEVLKPHYPLKFY